MELDLTEAAERMAEAAARDSLPRNGMFNSEQLEVMRCERLPEYRRLAKLMIKAALAPLTCMNNKEEDEREKQKTCN